MDNSKYMYMVIDKEAESIILLDTEKEVEDYINNLDLYFETNRDYWGLNDKKDFYFTFSDADIDTLKDYFEIKIIKIKKGLEINY